MPAPDIAYIVVRRYARSRAHPLSTDGGLAPAWYATGQDAAAQPLTGGRRGRYAALQKCPTEPANIFAARCHIRDRRPVYRMGLPHRLD